MNKLVLTINKVIVMTFTLSLVNGIDEVTRFIDALDLQNYADRKQGEVVAYWTDESGHIADGEYDHGHCFCRIVSTVQANPALAGWSMPF